MKTTRTSLFGGVAASALVALAACEDKSVPPSAAGGGGSGGALSGLAEQPSSLAGRSAAAGRDAARLAEQAQQQAAGMADELAGKAGAQTIGGLEFKVPTAWEKIAPGNQFQTAVYRVAADAGQGEALVVFFANIGGGVDSNINRWRGQVTGPNGMPADAKVERRTIAGLSAAVASMDGTYTGMGPMGQAAPAQENFSFRAVIYQNADTTGGPGPADLVVRFTGPKDVVEANKAAWEAMILGARKP